MVMTELLPHTKWKAPVVHRSGGRARRTLQSVAAPLDPRRVAAVGADPAAGRGAGEM